MSTSERNGRSPAGPARSDGPGARGDRVALERLLGDPHIAWLVDRVRGRIPAAAPGPMSGVVQLNTPTPEQRAAVVRLVGPPRRSGSALRVDLEAVEQILRRGPWPPGWRTRCRR